MNPNKLSRVLPGFNLAFAAMLPTPRSLAICVVLLCGMSGLHAQEPQLQLSSQDILFLTESVSIRTISGGVTNLSLGTAVGFLSANGNTYSVTTDGVNAFDVPIEKLMWQNDAAARQAAANAINAQMAAQLEQQRLQKVGEQQIAAENARVRDLEALEAARQEATQQGKQPGEQQRSFDPIAETDEHFRALTEARLPSGGQAQALTQAQIDKLNLREIHRDMNGEIISGKATDGVSVGVGETRSFEEQLRLVQSGKLPKETAAERQAREQQQRRPRVDARAIEEDERGHREAEREDIRYQIEAIRMELSVKPLSKEQEQRQREQEQRLRTLESQRDSIPH